MRGAKILLWQLGIALSRIVDSSQGSANPRKEASGYVAKFT
jgi:hypothetical protein